MKKTYGSNLFSENFKPNRLVFEVGKNPQEKHFADAEKAPANAYEALEQPNPETRHVESEETAKRLLEIEKKEAFERIMQKALEQLDNDLIADIRYKKDIGRGLSDNEKLSYDTVTAYLRDRFESFLRAETNADWPLELQADWMEYVISAAKEEARSFERFETRSHVDYFLKTLTNPEIAVHSRREKQSKSFDAWLWRTHPAKFMELFGKLPEHP